MGTLAVMDQTGDTKTTWDPSDPTSVKAARAAFDKAKKDGYVGYRVDESGEPTEIMAAFDPSASAVIMRPQMAGG